MEPEKLAQRVPIRELVRYYLRLGLLGFGGPVALVGQMEREVVADRGWLTKEQMREAIAICQSLPGPLAIQVGIYVAYLRCGFWGAWAGGWAFISLYRKWIVCCLPSGRVPESPQPFGYSGQCLEPVATARRTNACVRDGRVRSGA